MDLDTNRIRNASPAQLRDYYKELLTHTAIGVTTEALLHAVERGSISPFTFAPWLGVSRSPNVICRALSQTTSVVIRKTAIRQLKTQLCRPGWDVTWNEIGGTVGVLDILRNSSVLEVRELCKALGGCAKGKDLDAKRECYTELFKALHSDFFPEWKHKRIDQRPLAKYYGLIVPACSEDFVDQGIASGPEGVLKHARAHDLLKYHAKSLRSAQLESLSKHQEEVLDEHQLKELTREYPSSASSDSKWSDSMQFALVLLHRLVDLESSKVSDYFFTNELVRPLLHRAIRKRVEPEKIVGIVDLTIQYLEKHPGAGREITFNPVDVLHLVALCWTRRPQLFEPHLNKLCSLPIFSPTELNDLQQWDDFHPGIPVLQRYPLLRFCILASTGLDVDVDADLKKFKGPLSEDLLFKLDKKQSLSLFVRLRKARAKGTLVEFSDRYSVLSLTASYELSDGDPDLYYIYLLRLNNSEEAVSQAVEYIASRKSEALAAPDPALRGFYAKSTLYAAICSGSLSLYQKTLRWSARFIRDPIVISEVYPRHFPCEVRRLLSGIPEPIEKSFTISDLRQRVDTANTTLTEMFNTACTALLEPGFLSDNWKGVLKLFFDVVNERIKLAPKIRSVLNNTDEELYYSIWEPTITMLIAVETELNQLGRIRLHANTIRGVLDCTGGVDIKLGTVDTSTYMFLDNLARARDALWCKLRSDNNATVASLPKVLPRGLALQHLTAPWYLDTPDLELHAPYLAARVAKTLFPDRIAALNTVPLEDGFQKTVGVFVDSYQYALRLHIPKTCDKTTKDTRVQKVWHHASGALSEDRMSQEDAIRFWSYKKPAHLEEWPPVKFEEAKCKDWPVIPEPNVTPEPIVWNVLESGRPATPERDLGGPRYIDLSLEVLHLTSMLPEISDSLKPKPLIIPAYEVNPALIWSRKRNMSEGGVLAAMLYLDASFSMKECRLLDSAFPTKDDIRYPALAIHDDCIATEELNPFTAVRSLRKNLDAIPPTLLRLLASNVLDALAVADTRGSHLDDSGYSTLHEVALMLIARLSGSDRPDLATDLIVQTISDRPKSSSWHRNLLNPKILRRLPASQARVCLEKLSTRIIGTLQAKRIAKEQLEDDVDSEENGSRGESFVKITTIKMLAQLLQCTEFVEVDYALSILSALAQEIDHIDIRINIVKSLLAILRLGSTEHADQIFATLDPLAAVAGSLDERKPLTEEDWVTAEDNLSLPEITQTASGSTPSMLNSLLAHYRDSRSDTKHLPRYIVRVVLPTLARLEQQTARWTALFLRKHGINAEAQAKLNIPLVPREPDLVRTILEADTLGIRSIPHSLLEKYITYKTWTIAPPTIIKALNEKLQDDPTLQCEPDVQSWLHIYGQGLDGIKPFASFHLLSLLGKVDNAPTDSGLTPRIIQDQYLKLFTTVSQHDTPSYNALSTYLTSSLTKGDYLAESWWSQHGKQTVEAMISHVASLRTRDWERDPHRTPSVLPDTFPWRLLLLDYPWPRREDTDDDHERTCKVFAKQLGSIIDGISGSVYHHRLAQLKAYLAIYCVGSTKSLHTEKRIGKFTIWYKRRDAAHEALMHNRVLTAVYVGDISQTMLSWLTTADLLKVEVASYLVSISGNLDGVEKCLVERLKGLMETWKVCENEEVRRCYYAMEEKYFIAE